jgi:midasin
LLDDASGSVTLTERGDAVAIRRHPNFRLLAAMNPATDAGKKDLPQAIRARFTELFVDELVDPLELRVIASSYLDGVQNENNTPSENTETSTTTVNLYLHCRDLAERALTDAAGHKPRYTLRTLCRALSAAKNLVKLQHLSLKRALLEGFQLAFEGALDDVSANVVNQVFRSTLGVQVNKEEWDRPGRRPGGRRSEDQYVLVKPFWIVRGPNDPIDWSQPSENGRSYFILTPSIAVRLRKLARAVAAGPWPVLLEGPTSAGKTTLVEYLAARSGHSVVRINNHEHTGKDCASSLLGLFYGFLQATYITLSNLLRRYSRISWWLLFGCERLALVSRRAARFRAT